MEPQTKVKPIQIRQKKQKLQTPDTDKAEWIDCSPSEKRGKWILQTDKLIRNLAVVGGLLLVLVAVRNAGVPESQSVFSTLQASVNAQWDESVGKLSFVNSLLPESVQQVWQEKESLSVYAPMVGETVHAWSENEPYIELQGTVTDVRAVADGEIMSIAHGMEEERIVRIRHDDETESIYGNLQVCYGEVGDRVYAGDVFARVPPGTPLAFELRRDGRSIDPNGLLLSPVE